MTAKLAIVLAILLVVVGVGLWLYRRGRQDERVKVQEKTLEAVEDAKRAVDSVRSDPDHADSVRRKYERVLPDR